MENENNRVTPVGKRRKVVIRIGVALVAVAALVALLPWLIAVTPLRNTLVTSAIADPHLRAHVDSASFGWFTPLKLDGLSIDHLHNESQIKVVRIAADRSWLQLWMSAPDFGTIDIARPQISLIVTENLQDMVGPAPSEPSSAQVKPTLTAVVTEAAVTVRARGEKEPAIDLSQLSVTARVERRDRGRDLIIDPVVIFNRESLTPELCRGGLQLVAPALADATTIEGDVSFELKRFRFPLDEDDTERASELIDIRGILRLHEVTAGLDDTAIEAVLTLVAKLLQVEVPKTIRIADETELAFEVRDGRFYHEGLAFMLPELSREMSIRTSGYVGVDESLDLTVEAMIPLTLVHDGPISRQLSEHPFTLHVTGTLDQPKVELPDDQNWLADLAKVVLSDKPIKEELPLASAIIDVVGGLVEDRQKDDGPRKTPILDFIRGRNRQPNGDDGDADEGTPESATPILDMILQRRRERQQANEQPAGDDVDRPTPLLDRLRDRRSPPPSAEDDETATRRRPIMDRLRRRGAPPTDSEPKTGDAPK